MILVTGSKGFIGQHLMSRLEEEEVRTVNRSDGVELFSIPPEYFDDVTTIYHLAGYIGGDEKENQKTNVEGTRCILEQARKFDVKSFIFASSAAVYGSPRYLPIDEEHPTNPISPYGRSKLQAEGHVSIYGERYGIDACILRLFNPYGPGDFRSVIAKFLSRARECKPIIIHGSGEQTRDFIDVRDVVSAFTLLTGENGVFNIGSGRELSLNDVVALIRTKYTNLDVVYQPSKPGEVLRSVADISKAKNKGFKIKRTVEQFILEN